MFAFAEQRLIVCLSLIHITNILLSDWLIQQIELIWLVKILLGVNKSVAGLIVSLWKQLLLSA